MSTRTAMKAFLVLALSLLTAPTYAQDAKGKPAPSVGVDAVVEEMAHQTVPVLGRLVAQKSGVVSVLVKGVVEDMRVQVGDRLEPGNVIAVLAPNSLKWARELRAAEVKGAQANVATAKAQAKLRAQELKRLDNLRQSSAFSPARFEDAEQELAKAKSDTARAEADLMRARANFNLAEIDFANGQVKAPYVGVVSVVHTEVGTYLNAGQPVVTMVDDLHMEIEADVPTNRAQGLTPGTVVAFTLNKREGFAAVRAQVPEENPLTRTRKVRFIPEEGSLGEGAAANQNISLAIPSGPMRQAITVHKDGVVNKGGQQVVFVVEDGKAQIRTVKLGEAVGGRFTVLSGLKIGDQVVVRGNERLRPGQAVSPKPVGR